MAKTKVPISAQPVHRFPLHRGHVTTSNFMRFDISFARELAKCKVKFNHQEVVRTLALKRPLYSNIMLHNTAIFVPFRTVWEPWTDFKEDTPHNQPAGTGIIKNVPLIGMQILMGIFASGPFSTTATSAQLASGDVDFVSADGNTGYLLTPYGKWAWSMLVQLGYRPNPFTDKDQTVSALPLLCACKAYLDYYFPNGYAHYGDYAVLDGIMQRQVTYTLTSAEIIKIFNVLYRVAYSDDYFVNAFDNPTGPNDGVGSVDFRISDLSLRGSTLHGYTSIVQNNDSGTAPNDFMMYGTPYLAGVGSNGSPSNSVALYNLSQYQVDNLARLTSYVRRHQLAGSRALERYLLDWGVALDADKLKRSIKIDEKRFPLQVGEVMSNSDTYIPASSGNPATGAGLGDYTGRAVAYDGDLNFEFETDEFGYLFVISTIIPSVSYVQGYDRSTVHKTKTDFLTGEFDGIVTAIDSGELFVGARRSNNLGSPIGFTGNYPEYKTSKDNLSGLFLFPKTEKGLLGWETCRLWSDEVGDNAFNVVHSLDFMLGGDADQYNRIFMDDDNIDHFMIVHRDNFEIIQQALPLYDFFDWYDDDHQKVSIDVNGTKTN